MNFGSASLLREPNIFILVTLLYLAYTLLLFPHMMSIQSDEFMSLISSNTTFTNLCIAQIYTNKELTYLFTTMCDIATSSQCYCFNYLFDYIINNDFIYTVL